MGKSCPRTVPQVPHLQNGDGNSELLHRKAIKLNSLISVKLFEIPEWNMLQKYQVLYIFLNSCLTVTLFRDTGNKRARTLSYSRQFIA